MSCRVVIDLLVCSVWWDDCILLLTSTSEDAKKATNASAEYRTSDTGMPDYDPNMDAVRTKARKHGRDCFRSMFVLN